LKAIQRKLLGALFAIFGVMLLADAAAGTPAGTVVGLSGSCTDRGRALHPGDTVQIGDTLDVPAGGKLKLQMVDGSVIVAAPDSSMPVASYSIDGSGRNVRLALRQGVLHINSATRPFEVSTAVGTASVGSASADWFVKAEAGSAQVGVLVGVVDLTDSLTGVSVSIPVHWGTRLESGRAPVPPRRWTHVEFNAVIRLTE
jgi:ferric-dicitrate binding protein FerR (iron transport regulator)